MKFILSKLIKPFFILFERILLFCSLPRDCDGVAAVAVREMAENSFRYVFMLSEKIEDKSHFFDDIINYRIKVFSCAAKASRVEVAITLTAVDYSTKVKINEMLLIMKQKRGEKHPE